MKNALKRTLSLMLTVVMLVSCWVFTAPKADAATAGKYKWRITMTSSNATGGWDGSTLTVYGKPTNGTGTEKSLWSGDYKFNWSGETRYPTGDNTTDEFPTKVTYFYDFGGGWTHRKMDGWIYLDLYYSGEWHNIGSLQCYSYEWGENKGTKSMSVDSSKLPKATSTSVSGGSNVSVPTDGTSTNYSSAFSAGTVYDQYGVSWHEDATLSSNKPNGTGFSSNKVSVTSGCNRADNYKVTVTAKCGNASASKEITITTFDYIVEFKDWDGTQLKRQTGINYNSSATAPSAPSREPDESNHYAFSSWSGTYSNLTTGAQTKTVTATYTGTAHGNWTYSEISGNHTNHTKKCGSCTYSTTAAHTYGAPTITFADDGKTATAKRVCTTSGCGHTETKSLSMESGGGITSAVQIPATCLVKGTTRYTATVTFTKVGSETNTATATKDVEDINALGHDYGEWEVSIQPTCTEAGQKQCVCQREGCTESTAGHIATEDIDALGHSMQKVDVEPENGTDYIGLVYFECANCGLFQCAEYNQTKEKYEPVGNLVSDISEIEKNTQIVPSTVFNEYAENNMDFEHDYASRGGSLKIAAPYEYTDANTIQGMRFTASLFVPEGVALNCSNSDNYIVDFGFLWSQVPVLESQGMSVSDLRFNESTEETELPKNVYKMSVVKNNKGVDATEGTNDNFTGDNWTGVSAHEDLITARGTALTFNILINVKARNWKKDYCVRPYIKYKYNGTIYTIYDDGNGFDTDYSRNVVYIADKVVENEEGKATQRAMDYCQYKIIDNLEYIPE